MASLDTELVLMEAFDNHVEYHTVGEFIDFCVHGRTGGGAEWTTTSGGGVGGLMEADLLFLFSMQSVFWCTH